MKGALLNLLYSYPEIFLASGCFISFFLCYNLTRKSCLPINWPLVGMLPTIIVNLPCFHDWLTEALRVVGCTYQFQAPWFLGMDYMATCDPANVNHVFSVNFANYPKGEEFVETFDIIGDGYVNSEGDSWKMQRKMSHGLLNRPQFRTFVATSTRYKVTNGLLPFLNHIAEKKEAVVDLQDVFIRLATDMTFDLVFGVDPCSLSPELPAIPFAKAMDDAMQAVVFRHLSPSLWKTMRWLRVGSEKRLAEGWEVIDRCIEENIKRKKEEKIAGKKGEEHQKEDLMTNYIEDESMGSNDKFLRDTALSYLLAGRDTIGVSLTWFFWLVAENPAAKAKIREELKKHMVDCTAILFDAEEMEKLVYLHAALLESLRLYPPVPFLLKGALRPEILPSGHPVRAGTKIFFVPYSMARMEEVWGEDCSEFKPERWISERGTVNHVPACKFLAFNCGQRTCLGKNIALLQMKIVVAAMLSNFDMELVQGQVVEPRLSMILHAKNGLKAKVKQRKQAESQNEKYINGD